MDSLVGELISTTRKDPAEIKVETKRNNLAACDGERARRTASPEEVKSDVVPQTSRPSLRTEPERKPSMLHISRNTAFATHVTPFDNSKSSSSLPPTAPLNPSTLQPMKMEDRAPAPTQRFFEGLRFSHVISESCENLERAIVVHGGVVVTEAERLEGGEVDYVVVRL